jgi:hypothetical protein
MAARETALTIPLIRFAKRTLCEVKNTAQQSQEKETAHFLALLSRFLDFSICESRKSNFENFDFAETRFWQNEKSQNAKTRFRQNTRFARSPTIERDCWPQSRAPVADCWTPVVGSRASALLALRIRYPLWYLLPGIGTPARLRGFPEIRTSESKGKTAANASAFATVAVGMER